MYKENLVKNLYRAVVNPSQISNISENHFILNIFAVLRIWLTTFLLLIPVGMFIVILTSFFNYNLDQNLIFQTIEQGDFVLLFFMASIWAPIAEELAFRLPLKNTQNSFALGLSFICFFALNIAISPMLPQSLQLSLITFFLITAFIILIAFFIFKKVYQKFEKKISLAYKKYFSYIFYFSSILFAIIHILNYPNFLELTSILPIIILPQFILGITLAYTRIKYGFIFAVLFHFIHNTFILGSFYISSLISNQTLEAISNNPNDYLNLIPANQVELITIQSLLVGLFLIGLLISFILIIKDLVQILKKHAK